GGRGGTGSRRQERNGVVRLGRKVRREARIRRAGWSLHWWQREDLDKARLVDLREQQVAASILRVGDAISSREESEQAVKTPVLLVDHHNVIDLLEGVILLIVPVALGRFVSVIVFACRPNVSNECRHREDGQQDP